MDKISIASSQAVLEMPSFSSISSSLLVNSLVKIDCSRLHQTSMSYRFNSSTVWICLWSTRCWRTAQISYSPGLRSGMFGGDTLGARRKFGVSWCSRACSARCAGALSCRNIKLLPDTLRIAGSSMASWRRHYDVVKAASRKSVRYHQNFLFCNNALQVYWTVIVNKCMWLHFSRQCSSKWSGKFNYMFMGR